MNILSSSILLGSVGVLLLFLISFLSVHTPTLLQKLSKKEAEKPEEAPPQNTEVEPIYYIVEKKKKRVKESYSKPKQIRFK